MRKLVIVAMLGTMLAVGQAHARDCAWESRLDPTVANGLYPDQFANYWTLLLPAVEGETLTFKGEFPHTRYMSFVTYAGGAQSAEGLYDAAIKPDAGSVNPFIPGASRTAANRAYTVTAVFGAPPTGPRPDNTIYTTSADGSKTGRIFNIIYRTYRPDAAYAEDTGGVGLPLVTINFPDGHSVGLGDCAYPERLPGNVNETIAGSSVPWPSTFGYPGLPSPMWHKFYNFASAAAQGYGDNQLTGQQIAQNLEPLTHQQAKGGFADNPDNNYIFTALSLGYGRVMVLHAKMPTTPDTYPNTPVMPAQTQLRYWSLCSNDGPSTRYFQCVMDDTIVRDSNGGYTIVVSQAADKPANARPECGVNWLAWGPGSSTLLIVRNMLADASFTNSIQAAGYGTEAADMGAYYPGGTYTSAAAFDTSHPC